MNLHYQDTTIKCSSITSLKVAIYGLPEGANVRLEIASSATGAIRRFELTKDPRSPSGLRYRHDNSPFNISAVERITSETK